MRRVHGRRAELQTDRPAGGRVPHAVVLRRRDQDGGSGASGSSASASRRSRSAPRQRRIRTSSATIATEIGSQSVVVVLDVRRKRHSDEYYVWTHNGRNGAQRLATSFAAEAERLGAGEILVNSIDNDGLMKGYDLALATQIRRAVKVPITVLGGAGSLDHMGQLFRACGVVGAAAGSLFLFKGATRRCCSTTRARRRRTS